MGVCTYAFLGRFVDVHLLILLVGGLLETHPHGFQLLLLHGSSFGVGDEIGRKADGTGHLETVALVADACRGERGGLS